MIKDSFEGKIIKVDGMGKEKLHCKIFYNNRLKEEFNPSNQQKPIHLSGQGIYTFSFTSGEVTKSLSLKISLFTDDGAQWLPLHDSDELIETLPEDTPSPRFLIILCRSKNLHIIEESGEISEESSLNISESEENVNQNTEKELKISNTQEYLESLGSEFLDQSSIHDDCPEESFPNTEKLSKIWSKDNSEVLENDKESFEMFKEEISYRGIYSDLLQKYQELLTSLEKSNKKLSEYEEKFVSLIDNFNDQAKRSHDREDSLVELVSEKEAEIKIAQDEIAVLRAKNKKLELENLRYKDINQGLQNEINLISPSPLLTEVNTLRSLVSEIKPKITAEKIEEYEAKIFERDMTINSLQKTLLKNRPSDSDTKESQNLSVSIFDELDEAVKSHSRAMGLPEPLVKDKEQMYIYGNRKISLVLSNGNLMCRIGGTFKPFKEYMESFVLDTEVKTIRKRFSVDSGIDREYDAAHFQEALNKSLKLSGKNIKTSVLKRPGRK